MTSTFITRCFRASANLGVSLIIACAMAALTPAAAQSSRPQMPSPDFTPTLDKQVVEIHMRDGVTLHTEIYAPRNHTGALPIIYERTPYGLNPDSHGYSTHLRMYPELIADGYIFALQDSRGRGAWGESS